MRLVKRQVHSRARHARNACVSDEAAIGYAPIDAASDTIEANTVYVSGPI